MKKSGILCSDARRGSRASADAVIAPQRDEIPIEVLAQKKDLTLEAAPQLDREAFIGRRRSAVQDALLSELQRGTPELFRREGLQRRLRGSRQRAATDRNGVHQFIQ